MTAEPQENSVTTCREQWKPLIPRGEHQYIPDQTTTVAKKKKYVSWLSRTKRRNCQKDWVVLIYQKADSLLEPYALADLYEMEAGGEGTGTRLNTDILVHFDVPSSDHTKRLHIFPTKLSYDKSRTIEFYKNKNITQGIHSPIITSKKKNGSESQRLTEFLEWGITNYPAKHYMLIVWGHGQGWGSSGSSFGGIFQNETGAKMDIVSLKEVLKDITQRVLKKPFDLYASDSCLMQQVEVAYEIAPYTRFIVGSPQVQNFLGLPYRALTQLLNLKKYPTEVRQDYNEEKDEAYLFARAIPYLFSKSFQPRGIQYHLDPEGGRDFSMTALSSSHLLGEFYFALMDMGTALKQYLAHHSQTATSLIFFQSIRGAISFAPGMRDLGLFLEGLKQFVHQEKKAILNRLDSKVQKDINVAHKVEVVTQKQNLQALKKLQKSIKKLEDAIRNTVISRQFGTDLLENMENRYIRFSGVSLWLPLNEKFYYKRVDDFATSSFFKSYSKRWYELLKFFYIPSANAFVHY